MGPFDRPRYDVLVRTSDVGIVRTRWMSGSCVGRRIGRDRGICLIVVRERCSHPVRYLWNAVGDWFEHVLPANTSVASLLVFSVGWCGSCYASYTMVSSGLLQNIPRGIQGTGGIFCS